MSLAPDEDVHAAHRGAHDQPEVTDAEPLHEHAALRLDHVVIIIFWKTHPESVGRLRRFAVSDIVRKDDEGAANVERLAGTVELVGELRPEKLLAVAAG